MKGMQAHNIQAIYALKYNRLLIRTADNRSSTPNFKSVLVIRIKRGVIMNGLTVKILVILLMGFTFLGKLHAHGDHSSPCSGPHKNDPVCLAPPPPLPPPAISVYSATVDWLNEKIIIAGENFSISTTITIAGLPATIGSQTANQIEIPFDVAIGGIPKGNHNLIADDGPSSSTSSLSLFVKAENETSVHWSFTAVAVCATSRVPSGRR